MISLRLIMEKYISKNYLDQPFSYNGDVAPIRSWKEGIKSHPLYVVNPNSINEVCLVGVEPNVIIKMCRKSKDRIIEFEGNIKSSLSWFQGENGYIFCKNENHNDIIYSLEYVITGHKEVEHIDGDPLNHIFNNLKIHKYIDVSSEKNEMSF